MKEIPVMSFKMVELTGMVSTIEDLREWEKRPRQREGVYYLLERVKSTEGIFSHLEKHADLEAETKCVVYAGAGYLDRPSRDKITSKLLLSLFENSQEECPICLEIVPSKEVTVHVCASCYKATSTPYTKKLTSYPYCPDCTAPLLLPQK